jgi:hypothetical protein
VHFEAGEEAICMATTALTMSINSWAFLNVTTRSDDGRLGLLGGVLGCATEGLAWSISIGAIVNEKVRRDMGENFKGD